MTKNNRSCFVCERPVSDENFEMNKEVMLPVCFQCKGTPEEKKKAEIYLDSLAEGFVCGCI